MCCHADPDSYISQLRARLFAAESELVAAKDIVGLIEADSQEDKQDGTCWSCCGVERVEELNLKVLDGCRCISHDTREHASGRRTCTKTSGSFQRVSHAKIN